MACKGYDNLIDKYIEGLAGYDEESALMEHIEQCADCKKELLELKEILKATTSLESIDLPSDFTPLLMARIKEVAAEQKSEIEPLTLLGFFKDLPTLLLNAYLKLKRRAYVKAIISLCIIGVFLFVVFSPFHVNFLSSGMKKADDAAPANMEGASMTDYGPLDAKERSDIRAQNIMQSTSQDESIQSEGLYMTKGVAVERKIIRNAELSIYVEDFDKNLETAFNLAEKVGGYIENSYIEEGTEGSRRRAHIAMRVPQTELSSVLELIKPLGKLKDQHLSGDDITESYYDTTARVENLRQQEVRLLEILKIAKNVDEILKIESELNRVRTDIDLMTGQIMSWDKMVEFSLVNLNLIEQQPSIERIRHISLGTFFERGKQGFITAMNFLLKSLIVISELLGALLILFVIAVILFFVKIIYFIFRKFSRKKDNS